MGRHPAGWAPQWGTPTEPLLPPRGRGRWVWLVLMGAGFLTVLSWVLTHDKAAGAGLSVRSWLTLALAALVVVLLSAYRTAGARLLLRAIAEYTAVAVLAVLLATTTAARAPQPAHQPGKAKANAAGQLCPAVVRGLAGGLCDRLDQAWQQAKRKADRQSPPSTTTPSRKHR